MIKHALFCCTALSACSIPVDKQLHFIVGASAHEFQRVASPDRMQSTPLERCTLSILAGVGKEVHDHVAHGDAELADIVATVGGCLLVDFIMEKLNDRRRSNMVSP